LPALRLLPAVGQGKAVQFGIQDDDVNNCNGDDDDDAPNDYTTADSDDDAVDGTMRDPDKDTHNDELDEMPRDEREPYNPALPLLPESATTTPFRPGTAPDNMPATTTDNLPATTTDNLPATAIDNLPVTAPYNPLPSRATTDRSEEGSTAITDDGDDLTPRTPVTPRTPDADPQSTTKNTIHVAPPVTILHEYEAVDVSLLFLFTKEDADAALAVRLRTAEGIDIPTPDAADSQVPDDDAKPAIPFEYPAPIAPRKRGRPRKNLAPTQLMQFLSAKEQADFQLEAQLHRQPHGGRCPQTRALECRQALRYPYLQALNGRHSCESS
jgi:hypothetical protein